MSTTEPTVEQMRRLAARVFFEDCRNDSDYPHKDWHGQYQEMVPGVTVSEEFLRFVWDDTLVDLLAERFGPMATAIEKLLAVAEAFRDFTANGEENRIRGSLDRGKAALTALEAAP